MNSLRLTETIEILLWGMILLIGKDITFKDDCIMIVDGLRHNIADCPSQGMNACCSEQSKTNGENRYPFVGNDFTRRERHNIQRRLCYECRQTTA